MNARGRIEAGLAIAFAGALILLAPHAVARAAEPDSAGSQCTAAQGQAFIDAGRYKDAIRVFTCVIDAEPSAVEGYRGRIEAQLLLGRFSDAVRDYARVTAFVEPVHPDVATTIVAGYDARLAAAPHDIPALTGLSFAHWWFFAYASAVQRLNDLLAILPNDVYGNLFRGSSRLLNGGPRDKGVADLMRAIALAPQSPDVHYVVADAYTYGLPDPPRALAEATLALDGGLDTPRVHAILAGAHNALGDVLAAAAHIDRHLELVTTELVTAGPLAPRGSLTLPLVPGRSYDIAVPASAGQTIAILTSSRDFGDTILVLLAPDGTPVYGSDDARQYFAQVDYVAEVTGTYRLKVTSFESVNTGELLLTRR